MRDSIFSEALKQQCRQYGCNQVSPKAITDALANEDTMPELGMDSDEEEQEGRVIRSQKIIYQPSAQE